AAQAHEDPAAEELGIVRVREDRQDNVGHADYGLVVETELGPAAPPGPLGGAPPPGATGGGASWRTRPRRTFTARTVDGCIHGSPFASVPSRGPLKSVGNSPGRL